MTEKKDLRIVFMGTPDFAVESLKALVENDYNVVGVVTMPDKPAGRGYQLQQSAVKKYALEKGLPILQPEKLKDEAFLNDLKAWQADIQVVVAFRMLPEVVWNMPRLGTFNLHGSLLPQFRGAAPINWAIINGEKETGVTTFFLSHEIDTGEIIFHEKTQIGEYDNAGDIHDRLMKIGAGLVVKTIDAVLAGDYKTIAQENLIANQQQLKPAPKIFKDTCRIDWNQPKENIYNHIRGLSPYPVAWTELITPNSNPAILKVYKTEKREGTHQLTPGRIVSDNKTYMDIAVPEGYIRILTLQLAGKKQMDITDFLRGYKVKDSMLK